jgi:hypothetical protein
MKAFFANLFRLACHPQVLQQAVYEPCQLVRHSFSYLVRLWLKLLLALASLKVAWELAEVLLLLLASSAQAQRGGTGIFVERNFADVNA